MPEKMRKVFTAIHRWSFAALLGVTVPVYVALHGGHGWQDGATVLVAIALATAHGYTAAMIDANW